MRTGTGISVVFCTCPPALADELASRLVEAGRAACVSIIPAVTSVYRWEGRLERSGESLLIIKCSVEGVGALTQFLVEAHPYDVPEVIALDVQAGYPAYVEWVIGAMGRDGALERGGACDSTSSDTIS